MTHGLVIGKFYPPHVGHHHLISTAAAQVSKLSVLVLGARRESISIADRVRWLTEIHPGPSIDVIGGRCDVPIDLDSDPVWAAHVALMRATLETRTVDPVDVVFTAEPYGSELARRLGATHVDVGRSTHPVSGTAVRHDLAGSWDLLHPIVRAGLTTRVVVLGAESTGTTTVSKALAETFRTQGGVWTRTQWVPEYGRDHTVLKYDAACAHAVRGDRPTPALEDLSWEADDFAYIAQRQTALEEAAAQNGSPVLICDTDALTTRVWERRYVGEGSFAAAEAVPILPPRATYLLTDHVGVPFLQDGWRDGEHVRASMTNWFVEEVTKGNHSWALLTGTLQERVALARRITHEALSDTVRLADPIEDARSTPADPDPAFRPALAVRTLNR